MFKNVFLRFPTSTNKLLYLINIENKTVLTANNKLINIQSRFNFTEKTEKSNLILYELFNFLNFSFN